MSVTINIGGTLIEFPSSGASPNWAPALIEFAQAVELKLQSVGSVTDIPPTQETITSYNTLVNLSKLSFPTTLVRAAEISYAIKRTGTISENGKILAIYDDSKWILSRDFVGDADCTFEAQPNGQFQIKVNDAGKGSAEISYFAKTLEQP